MCRKLRVKRFWHSSGWCGDNELQRFAAFILSHEIDVASFLTFQEKISLWKQFMWQHLSWLLFFWSISKKNFSLSQRKQDIKPVDPHCRTTEHKRNCTIQTTACSHNPYLSLYVVYISPSVFIFYYLYFCTVYFACCTCSYCTYFSIFKSTPQCSLLFIIYITIICTLRCTLMLFAHLVRWLTAFHCLSTCVTIKLNGF